MDIYCYICTCVPQAKGFNCCRVFYDKWEIDILPLFSSGSYGMLATSGN